MSQINLEEKISEKIKFDYRERLKTIQNRIKNNKSISRIDEIYLQKVLDLESLPVDFIKKNEILRKNDSHYTKKTEVISKIINDQTKESIKNSLYKNKLKSEISTLKEKSIDISNQKEKFDEQIEKFKNEKENDAADLHNELKQIKSKMVIEKDNVEKQESEINNLNLHYQKIVSGINNDVMVAKKQYDNVIKKRESLMREMQLLKHEYDIATKRRNELEIDLNSEKNIELTKTNKINESIEQILQQNKLLNDQIKTESELRDQNLGQISQTEQRITKLDSLLKTTTNLLSYIKEQKILVHELVKENETYREQFNERLLSINKMKKLVDENFEILTRNFKINN